MYSLSTVFAAGSWNVQPFVLSPLVGSGKFIHSEAGCPTRDRSGLSRPVEAGSSKFRLGPFATLTVAPHRFKKSGEQDILREVASLATSAEFGNRA